MDTYTDEVARRLRQVEITTLHDIVWIYGLMAPESKWEYIVNSAGLATLLNKHGWTLTEYIHACKFLPCEKKYAHMTNIFAGYE